MKVVVYLRCEEELRDKLVEIAERAGSTMNTVANEILADYLGVQAESARILAAVSVDCHQGAS